MKKVLFFIPSLKGRGAEKVLVNLLNNLDTSKYDITLLTLFNVGTNKKYLKSNIKYKYIFKRIFRGNIHLFKLLKPESLFKKMIKEEYDIIVSYLEGATTRIVSGCLNPKTKLINWVHNETKELNDLTKTYRNYNEFKNCMKKYDKTIFVSNTAKISFEQKTKLNLKSEVVYNLVEDEKIRNMANEEVTDIKFDKDKINLISVGGLVHQKGYGRLLRIYKKILEEDKDIHLYILGEGNKRKDLERYINQNNMEKYVTLLGYRENPYKYVKKADLFVCSSYYEGYSTAVTEALIVETPVITTLCSGMEELLESGKYGVITENSEDGLYNALYNIVKDRNKLKEYKRLAIERSKYFDLKKNLQENERILDE